MKAAMFNLGKYGLVPLRGKQPNGTVRVIWATTKWVKYRMHNNCVRHGKIKTGVLNGRPGLYVVVDKSYAIWCCAQKK